MSAINGGPAFPVPSVGTGDPRDGMTTGSPGMTLRDYFAAKAITGLVCQEWYEGRETQREAMVAQAYAIADAMLEVRNK